MKCWNCDGLGGIPSEDDPFVYTGDSCPICQGTGRISFLNWLKSKLWKIRYCLIGVPKQ